MPEQCLTRYDTRSIPGLVTYTAPDQKWSRITLYRKYADIVLLGATLGSTPLII